MCAGGSQKPDGAATDPEHGNELLLLNGNTIMKHDDRKAGRRNALPLCKISPDRRLVLIDPKLFMKKTALVVIGSYALIPLLANKATMSAGLYVMLLLVIHIVVLVVYLWRVNFRSLDVDRVSLGARVLGLIVVTWLLSVVSGWQDREHTGVLAAQMLVLCVVHTFVLALLMVAVEHLEGSDAHKGRESSSAAD